MLYSVLSGLSCLLKNVYREEEMQNTSFLPRSGNYNDYRGKISIGSKQDPAKDMTARQF